MARTVDRAVAEFLDGRVHYWTRLWKILRDDNTVLRIAEHNRPVVYDGATYSPAEGASGGSVDQGRALDPKATRLVGIVAASVITDDDLRAGRYRNARVDRYVVDWRYPFAGKLRQDTFWIADVRHDGTQWRADIEGVARYLKARVGKVKDRFCQNDLGDSICRADLSADTHTGVRVDVVTDRRVFFGNSADIPTTEDTFFAFGRLTWETGANAGITQIIRAYTDSTRKIELHVPAPLAVTTSDTFKIVVGCNKTQQQCISRFNNIGNFQGSPFIPGNDRITRPVEAG